MCLLSIVIPVYNEEANVRPLFKKIQTVCESLGAVYEIRFVDDGSQDDTFKVLSELHKEVRVLRVIQFEKNAGQTAAMAAGFEFARGTYIVSMDGDMQNDPGDIPKLLNKLNEGYDLVCGWPKERQDELLTRRIPSVVANWIIAKVMGVEIHDNGCSLKSYRASVIKQVSLYAEMHRFIPAISTVVGTQIAEIGVTHHSRRFGKSKYGLGQIWRVVLDIIAFKCIISTFQQNPDAMKSLLPKCDKLVRFFIHRCKRRPLRIFGPLGAMAFTLSTLLIIWLSKINTVVGLSLLLMGSGVLMFCFGIFGELVAFNNAKHLKDYRVKTVMDNQNQ